MTEQTNAGATRATETWERPAIIRMAAADAEAKAGAKADGASMNSMAS